MAKALGILILVFVLGCVAIIAALVIAAFSGNEPAVWIVGHFGLYLGLPILLALLILFTLGAILCMVPAKGRPGTLAASQRIEPGMRSNLAGASDADSQPQEEIKSDGTPNRRMIGWIAIVIGVPLLASGVLDAAASTAGDGLLTLVLMSLMKVRTLVGIGLVLFGLADLRNQTPPGRRV